MATGGNVPPVLAAPGVSLYQVGSSTGKGKVGTCCGVQGGHQHSTFPRACCNPEGVMPGQAALPEHHFQSPWWCSHQHDCCLQHRLSEDRLDRLR